MGIFDFFRSNSKDKMSNNEKLRDKVREWISDEILAESKYGHISNWDTSEITNMSSLFEDAESFNQPLDKWDVSNVTNMAKMFSSAESFNQPINNWDVSNVTIMNSMFFGAESFNQPLDKWDVSNVIDMRDMFLKAITFNQSISNWNMNNVLENSDMFFGATNYNQFGKKKEIYEGDEVDKFISKESIENKNGFNRIFENDGSYIEVYKKDGIHHRDYKKFSLGGVLINHFENLIALDSNDIYPLNVIELDGNDFMVNGKYKTWHTDGSIQCEANFVNGKLNGRKIEIGEDGMIDHLGFFKYDESIDWDNEENMKINLREIQKYMINGVKVYPVVYMGLCESLGYDGGWSDVDPLKIITNILSIKKPKP